MHYVLCIMHYVLCIMHSTENQMYHNGIKCQSLGASASYDYLCVMS
jgi:hypothetical protein